MPTKKNSPKTCKKRARRAPSASIVPGSPQFKQLQREWYNKLSDAGFKDLEKFIGHDMQPAELLHGPSLRNAADMFTTEKRHYYRLWTCFVAHNHKNLNGRIGTIAKMYAEGATYREISARLKELNQVPSSITEIHYTLKELEARVKLWNIRSPNGLDYESPFED